MRIDLFAAIAMVTAALQALQVGAQIDSPRSVLLVRVEATSNEGVVRGAQCSLTLEEMEKSVFGDNGDTVTLKSQYEDCSHGQLELNTVKLHGTNLVGLDAIISSKPSDGVEKMKSQVYNILKGTFGVNDVKNVANHIMVCYPKGVLKTSFVSDPNGFYSGFDDKSFLITSLQFHALGSNLGFGRSGDVINLNQNVFFGDWSGMMGRIEPEIEDPKKDFPKMCFNAAKSWLSGWYSKRTKVLDGKKDSKSYCGELAGIAENPNKDLKVPIIVKLLTTENDDLYITFNSAVGINAQTQEGANKVMIVQQEGVDQLKGLQSWLINIADENADEPWTSSKVFLDEKGERVAATVEVEWISPGQNRASVKICIGECVCDTSPSSEPSPSPTFPPTTIFPSSRSPSGSPTSSPSTSPSSEPSPYPSSLPSPRPSPSPTSVPTVFPTGNSPSMFPTPSPTAPPSSEPSPRPSSLPSPRPSPSPTSVPTVYPTGESPSVFPTPSPSASPFSEPSPRPSSPPSLRPTSSPTSVLTIYPTGNSSSVFPTSSPTAPPSSEPSSRPSSLPSPRPSPSPTSVPTVYPTGKSPSVFPTPSPSAFPSSAPSPRPSSPPSLRPTSSPTSVLTIYPTGNSSSVFPTSSPTAPPSSEPSSRPSSTPSPRPTSSPTSPSSVPSLVSSSIPSRVPSEVPSSVPSSAPISEPSLQPSSGPSSVPSRVPSLLPSSVPSQASSASQQPTESDYVCEDKTSLFYLKTNINGNDVMKDCAFLRGRTPARQKRICAMTVPTDKPLAKDVCPITCDTCRTTSPSVAPSVFPSRCTERSKDRFWFFNRKGKKRTRNCSALQKMGESKKKEYCALTGTKKVKGRIYPPASTACHCTCSKFF